MRPFLSTMPSVRSRASSASQRTPRGLFAQALVALLLLLGGGWSPKASATFSVCDMQTQAPVSQSGTGNQVLNYNVAIVENTNCNISGATGTVSISFDSTGGASLTAPAGGNFGGGIGSYPFSVQLGPNPGFVQIQVVCNSGCSTPTTLFYFANIVSVPNMTLTKALTANTDPDGSGLISPGDVLTYTVTATNTGNGPLTNLIIDDPLITPNTITCPTTAVGATCVLTGNYTVTATDQRRGSLVNTAQSTADDFCGGGAKPRGAASTFPGFCQIFNASTNNKVDPSPMMTVSKQLVRNTDGDHSNSVTVGDVLLYAVTAMNNGQGNLTNVTVSDPLLSPNTVTCATVGPHASCKLQGSYTVTTTDLTNGSIVNTGSATADHIPGTTNSNTVTTPVYGTHSMTVTKQLTGNTDGDGNGKVSQGDVLTFTVTATNTGNVQLNNVVVQDPLTTPNSATCPVVAPGGTCALVGTYTVTATDVTNGAISNTGRATSNEFCGDGCTYFSASLRTPVFASSALSLTKVLTNNADNDDSGNVTPGDVLTFTVTATNTGNTTLTNVQVNDPLTAPNSASCASIAPAGTCVLVGTYTVTANDAKNGAVSNTGSAKSDQTPSQSVTVRTPVASNRSLQVSKTLLRNADGDHSNSVTLGDVLTFQVTATNNGNVPLTHVQVSDPLTSPNSKTCPNLAVGASCVLTGTYTVTATDVSNGAINNTGSATANEFCGEGCTFFRSSLSTPVAATPVPAMTVVKQLTHNADNDDSGNVSVGDVLTFTVTATNTGTATLTNVQVSDPLTTPNSANCASVPVNGTCVLTGNYTVKTSDAQNGSINNTGTAIATQITQPVSNTLNTPVAPLPANNPAMTVVKQLTHNADNDDSGNVSVGDVLTYTVTATNTGNVTLTSVHISDPLTTPSSASCANVPVNGTCVLTGTYTVKTSDAQNGSISNTGAASTAQITQQASNTLNTPVAPLPANNPAMTVVKQLTHNADNDGSGNVSAGDVLTFTVTATNTGNVTLTNVHVTDPLTKPSSVNCESVPINGTCVLTGTYTVSANDAKNGTIGNTGTATATQITQQISSTLNTPVAPPPTPNPAMTVVKQLTHNADNDDSGNVSVGDVLTFTVSATNTGNVTLTNVHVSDPLTTPNSKLCVSVAVGATCVLTGTYTVTASDASAGSITNTGAATANQIEGPTNSNTLITSVAAIPTFQIVIVSGNGQSGTPGQPLAQDFVVAVTPFTDAAVNTHASVNNQAIVGLSGVPVSWQILSGGGSLSNGNNTFTDTSGHSSNRFTLGTGTGQQQVQVCVQSGSCVTFTVNSVAPSANLSIVSGNGQTLVPGATSAPLVVHLTNGGSPVANAVIHWSASNATLASATSTTNANGDASNTAKVQSPGAATVTANSTSPSAGPVTFNMNGGFSNIPGLTPKESELANALDHACTALLGLESLTPGQADLLHQCEALAEDGNPTEVKNALDQLFANIAFLETSAALLIESQQFDNIKARIAALRSGTGHTHFGGLAFQTPDGTLPIGTLSDSALGFADAKSQDKDKKDEVGSDFDRWGFFASGTFGWGSSDPRQVTPGFGFHTNGLTAGVDYRYNDHMIFGLAGGYAKYKADANAGAGGLDTSGWSMSAYTTLFKQDSWYMDGVFTWGTNNFDITRRIVYTLTTNSGTTTLDQTATGSSGGSTIAGALTFGRDFNKGPWSFGPYFRGTWTKVSFDNFHETLNPGNGSGVGLFVQTQDLKSVASVLGGKINYVMSENWGVLMPHAEVEWNHEFHDNPDSITARFLNDPTLTPITVKGDPTDTDFFRLGLGLSFVLPKGRSGFVYYEKTLGRTGVTQDNLAIGIRIEF